MEKKHPLSDLNADILDHIERETQDNIERGMAPEEARFAALRKFGNVTLAKEEARVVWIPRWLDDVNRDFRYAARLLRRNPIFALTAALSLAIGIGASTTVFTAANTLLLRTAPGVAEPDRLVDINRTTGEIGVEPIMYPQYLEIRERATLFQDVYAYGLNLSPMSLMEETVQSGAAPVFASVVTPNYFMALGVSPSVGRVFGEHDTGSVVVLSHRFWTRRFNADPAVVGTAVRLTDRLFTVVGVARSGVPRQHGPRAQPLGALRPHTSVQHRPGRRPPEAGRIHLPGCRGDRDDRPNALRRPSTRLHQWGCRSAPPSIGAERVPFIASAGGCALARRRIPRALDGDHVPGAGDRVCKCCRGSARTSDRAATGNRGPSGHGGESRPAHSAASH